MLPHPEFFRDAGVRACEPGLIILMKSDFRAAAELVMESEKIKSALPLAFHWLIAIARVRRPV